MTTVALIDDHKIFCESLANLINDFEGFAVSWCAQDGEKAIQFCKIGRRSRDIILLDIKMPRMSGAEVALFPRLVSARAGMIRSWTRTTEEGFCFGHFN